MRLFDAGELLQPVFDIIMANSRLPDFVRCDLWAQVATSRRDATRVTQLVETYGVETFKSSLENRFEEGERRARRAGAFAEGHFPH